MRNCKLGKEGYCTVGPNIEMPQANKKHPGRKLSVGIALLLVVLAGMALAACGSSDSSGSTSASTSEPSSSSEETTTEEGGSPESAFPPYKGEEAKYPTEYAEPENKEGEPFTIAFLSASNTQKGLLTAQENAQAKIEEFGGKMIAFDAKANITTQVNQLNEALTQNVDGIILNALDTHSMRPGLEKAKSLGIPVVTINDPGAPNEPIDPLVVANSLQGFDQSAYYNMAVVAKAAKKGAEFGTVGFAIPVPYLKYLVVQAQKYGEAAGMKFVGEVDAQSDTSSGYATAVSALLASNPDMEALFCFNDDCAVAAASVARSNGKDLIIAGSNGEKNAFEAIEAGTLISTYAMGFAKEGEQAAVGLYNVLTNQNLPLPKLIAPQGTLVTQENVSSVEPVG